MTNILRLAMIGTVLAAGISVAAAEGTGRASYDDPVRYWNNDLVSGPASDRGNGPAGMASGYNSGAQTPGEYYGNSHGTFYGRHNASPYE